jgi:RNA polymerase sigma factor (sigma-70 family)
MDNTTMHINATDLLEQPAELIHACINGDRQSQNRLYEQFASKMFGVCMRYSKNREEAEDILQEGFIQVFKSLRHFKFAGSFEGWVRKIMVNCAIQHFRSKLKMHPVVDIENSQVAEMSNENIIEGLQKKDLLKMVQALPPSYRMIFNLYVFEGMKHREIAELLDISEGTSKSNFFDAKLLLQKAVTNSLKIAQNY